MAPPSGTVTFVLTDVEGSTKLARALGDRYADLIGRHHDLLRAVWRAHDGYELFTEGDAFIVAFGDADDAVLAAVDAQRAIGAEQWIEGSQVRVRIGLHSGYARPVDGEYRALALNQAARIVGCAHGGQTFATDEVVDALTTRTRDVSTHPLGRYRVRDFDTPVRLHAVTAAGAPIVEAAPRVRPAEGHNIVPPPTALVGREADVGAVLSRLAPQTITTIAGAGGVGKTRVALEVGMLAAPEWPDGVWLVDLTPVAAVADVPGAIAVAVGASISRGQDTWPDVLTHLEQRQALIVLDNCEHLSDGVARLVRDLTTRCPSCAVLATSRVPLGLIDERIHRLGMLAVDDVDDPGVRLFLDRAADGDRLVTADVVALCRELDGLPLAIELAAVRTRSVSAADILGRLRSSPTLLQSRDPGLPERQRSLTRSLDWSYDLLDPAAQAVYGRLSVFAAGFDLETAEEVCSGDDVGHDDVGELVWGLVDASLVQPDETVGATRYRMLQVVQAHAAARAGDAERIRTMRRLASWALDRVGPDRSIDRDWQGAMEVELDNVRHIVATLATTDQHADEAVAQTLAWSIGRYHDVRDAFRAGIRETGRWADTLIRSTPERVALLGILTELHLRLAEIDDASRVLAVASELAADVGVPSWDTVLLDRARGEIALRSGDPHQAVEIARHALPNATTHRAQGRLYNMLAIALGQTGDWVGATEMTRREIEAFNGAGMETFVTTSYGNLAETLLRLGDHAGAAASQLQCLELSRATGGLLHQGFSVIVAAHLVAAEGAWERAVELQFAADVGLDGIEWVAYPEDVEQRRRLLDDARAALGDERFATAATAGAALSFADAADIATIELRRIAAKREEPV